MTALRARFLVCLALLVPAATALAQAAVTIQVRTAEGQRGEAVVSLTPQGGGTPRSCRARNGTCRIAGVPAGRYVVTAQPISGGEPPIPHPVPIPPGGEVTISVTLR